MIVWRAQEENKREKEKEKSFNSRGWEHFELIVHIVKEEKNYKKINKNIKKNKTNTESGSSANNSSIQDHQSLSEKNETSGKTKRKLFQTNKKFVCLFRLFKQYELITV